FYEGLVDELLAVADQLQYASWEYLDDPGEAEDAYWGWLEGTAQDAREEQPWRYPDDASYAFVTVLVLAPARGLTGRLLDELTDIEDEDGVSADLLDHLLRMLPTLDFPSVTSDVVMVRPGRGGWGVMETQLGDGTYHHLGPVL
ncbi:MAG: hypothetical protein KC656_33010, partial [Myxococcales bacterium]|nr:hypothetical protein [Myxococcales bacterium]